MTPSLAPDVQLAALTAPGQPIPTGCDYTPSPTTGDLVMRATFATAEGVPTLVTLGRCTTDDGKAGLVVTAWIDSGDRLGRLGADARPAMWGAADPASGTARLAMTPGDGHAVIVYTDSHEVTVSATLRVTLFGGVEWQPAVSGA